MKKSEALGIATLARLLVDELTKMEAIAKELDLHTRQHQLNRLTQLHEFLTRITEQEYGEISSRPAGTKLKAQQLF